MLAITLRTFEDGLENHFDKIISKASIVTYKSQEQSYLKTY